MNHRYTQMNTDQKRLNSIRVYPCSSVAKILLVLILVPWLSGCAGGSRPVTTSEATFISVEPHEIIVQLDSIGAFATSRSLPLGNSVNVTVAGQPASLAKLRSGRDLLVQPTIGIPTSLTLQDTLERAGEIDSAVVYDHFGMKKSWQAHLDWLASNEIGRAS